MTKIGAYRKKRASSDPASTPVQDEADDDRMSLSSLSSNEQIIEQPLNENQMYANPTFSSDFLSVPPPSTPQIGAPLSNPLIPALYQRPSAQLTQPRAAIRAMHIPPPSIAPAYTMHTIVPRAPMQPQSQFYGDHFAALSFWNQAQRAYVPTLPEAPSASYFSYNNTFSSLPCTSKPPPNFMPTGHMPADGYYVGKEYSGSMLERDNEASAIPALDSRIINCPHYKSIE